MVWTERPRVMFALQLREQRRRFLNKTAVVARRRLIRGNLIVLAGARTNFPTFPTESEYKHAGQEKDNFASKLLKMYCYVTCKRIADDKFRQKWFSWYYEWQLRVLPEWSERPFEYFRWIFHRYETVYFFGDLNDIIEACVVQCRATRIFRFSLILTSLMEILCFDRNLVILVLIETGVMTNDIQYLTLWYRYGT